MYFLPGGVTYIYGFVKKINYFNIFGCKCETC